MPRSLEVACRYGLCNRLMVLTSGRALSEATGRTFSMLWPQSEECSARFEDLYENDWSVHSISDEEFLTQADFPFFRRHSNLLTDESEQVKVQHWGWLSQPHLNQSEAPILRRRIGEFLNALQPIQPLQERLDQFRNAHFSDVMIGVHVRLGDKFGMNTNAGNTIPQAMRAVDQYLEEHASAGIFLCTDDGAPHPDGRPTVTHGVRAAFKKRYGGRVVQTTPRTMQRWKRESIQDALIDLMLLRSTDNFVGTQGSSFSMIAVHSSRCTKRRMINVDAPPMTLLRRTVKALGWRAPASEFTARHRSWGRVLVAIKTVSARLQRRENFK